MVEFLAPAGDRAVSGTLVITGSGSKAKIWDKANWDSHSAPQLDAGRVADMFDQLGL